MIDKGVDLSLPCILTLSISREPSSGIGAWSSLNLSPQILRPPVPFCCRCNTHNDPQDSFKSFYVSSVPQDKSMSLELRHLKDWSLLTSGTSTGLCRRKIRQFHNFSIVSVKDLNSFEIYRVIATKDRLSHV